MSKLWSRFDDDFMMKLLKSKNSLEKVAERLGCSVEEVRERIAYLEQVAVERLDKQSTQSRADGFVVNQIEKDAIEHAFTLLCAHYNQLGEYLKDFSTLISSPVTQEALAVRVGDLNTLGLKPSEYAKELLQNYTILPRVVVRLTPPDASSSKN